MNLTSYDGKSSLHDWVVQNLKSIGKVRKLAAGQAYGFGLTAGQSELQELSTDTKVFNVAKNSAGTVLKVELV